MKFNSKTLLFFMALLLTLNSCIKEELNEDRTLNLADKVLTLEEIFLVAKEIQSLMDSSMLKSTNNLNYQEEMRIIMQPLVDNGREIYEEIISNVNLLNFGFTETEINSIVNMDDTHLAELSLTMSAVHARVIGTDQVIGCIAAALGINELHNIITNTTQLITAKGATQLLKVIAKRYLGWIGVGVAVYSFGVCIDVW
jgi:hypothetical protein